VFALGHLSENGAIRPECRDLPVLAVATAAGMPDPDLVVSPLFDGIIDRIGIPDVRLRLLGVPQRFSDDPRSSYHVRDVYCQRVVERPEEPCLLDLAADRELRGPMCRHLPRPASDPPPHQ